MDLMIPDKTLSISRRSDCSNGMAVLHAKREALHGQFWMHWRRNIISAWIHRSDDLSERMCSDVLIYGTDGKEVKVHYKGQRGEGVYDVAFEGLIRNVERRYRETFSESSKAEYESFMRITPCKTCKGQRLKPSALAVTVAGKNIYEITSMSVETSAGSSWQG